MSDAPAAPAADSGDATADGQGAAGEQKGGAFYASALDAITDPELRAQVEASLKESEGKVTQRLQTAADFQKQWEPFGEMGLQDLGPEGVTRALTLDQIFTDPAAITDQLSDDDKAWLEENWAKIGDSFGFFDEGDGGEPEGEPAADDQPEYVKQLLERIDGLEQRLGTQQEVQEDSAADQQVAERITELDGKHGFDEQSKQVALGLAHSYAQSGVEWQEALEKGYADAQRLKGAGQAELIEGASSQPEPAQRGGQAHTVAEKPRSFKDAEANAAAKFAAAATG